MVFFATRGLLGPSGTNAGDIDVGAEVILNENGQPVNYLVVNQGIPENSPLYDASCGGTWLLRKDIRENGAWNSSGVNTLAGSTITTTMAGYVDDYDPAIQEAIKTVKIPYCIGNGSATINSGANGLECKVFPLGGYEVGWTQANGSNFPVDGAKLSYFGASSSGNSKRIAYLNSIATDWWTRSCQNNRVDNAWRVSNLGLNYLQDSGSSVGIRPAFIIPYEFKFASDQIVT